MNEYVIAPVSAFLYAEPEEHAVCVDEALCGMAVTILKEHPGGWVRIRTEYGYEGFLRFDALAEPGRVKSNAKQTVYAFAADLLTAPDVKAPPLMTLTTGCTVYLNETLPRGWAHVSTANGREGYLRSAFIRPVTERVLMDTLCEHVTQTALLYQGAQYRWGGKSMYGIDCSGLCFMAYWLNGIAIYRDARIEPGYPVKEIPPSAAQKGDMIFFPGHVGLYLGDGLLLHSSEAGNGVNVAGLSPDAPGYDAELAGRVLKAGSVFA